MAAEALPSPCLTWSPLSTNLQILSVGPETSVKQVPSEPLALIATDSGTDCAVDEKSPLPLINASSAKSKARHHSFETAEHNRLAFRATRDSRRATHNLRRLRNHVRFLPTTEDRRRVSPRLTLPFTPL